MAQETKSQVKVKAGVALALAFAAGCVDIIGFIRFGHAFTAHLTGETVHLGQGVIEAKWEEVSKAGVIIAIFVTGSIVGRTIIEVGSRAKVRSAAMMCLLLEGALIAVVIPCSRDQMLSLGLLAAAMGVQTATLTRLGPLTVHTTFVTGMLNKFAQLISHVCFLTYDVVRGSDTAAASRAKVFSQSRFIFAIWLLYLLGAAVGTLTTSRWGVYALMLPVMLTSVLACVDLISPLAVEEERDASER